MLDEFDHRAEGDRQRAFAGDDALVLPAVAASAPRVLA
jgi:hypothetical protein